MRSPDFLQESRQQAHPFVEAQLKGEGPLAPKAPVLFFYVVQAPPTAALIWALCAHVHAVAHEFFVTHRVEHTDRLQSIKNGHSQLG